MSDYFVLAHSRARQLAAERCATAPDGWVVTFKEPTRSGEQSAKMWAMLGDISKQVQWNVDGKLQLVDKESWKEILSAGLTKTQRVAQGIDGGFVLLGSRTSKMGVKQMAELIEFIQWFGAENGVDWSEQ